LILTSPAKRYGRLRLIALIFIHIHLVALASAAYAAEINHIVAPGESLARIAQQYNVSLASLTTHNDIADPNHILIGQRLIIPLDNDLKPFTLTPSSSLPAENGYYTIQRGDSLAQIAKDFGMALGDLLRLNGLADPNFIWVGQQLRVSARVTSVQAERPTESEPAAEIYVIKAGDSLAQIAKDHGSTVAALMAANGLPNPNFIWIGQRLRIQTPPTSDLGMTVAGASAHGRRWIEIDLSDQTLTAWQGDMVVMHTTVSTGKASTPTVIGRFAIGTKLESQHMTGPDYDLPGVPWVMYFYEDYAIHGAYWHANFGAPTSHGCVNMRMEEAQSLYNWATPGTEVYVKG
jgi:LysM repeat protein